MITPPTGWTLRLGINKCTVVAPEGPPAGLVRCFERLYPLCRLGDIVQERLRSYYDLSEAVVGAPERLVTREGEHAALITLRGRVEGGPAQVSLGVVFGDDYYARLEGIALREDCFGRLDAVVRELVVSDAQVLGARRRRYDHAPPAGWQPLVRGFITDWLAPGFPGQWAVLTVHPAAPITPRSAGLIPGLLAGAAEHGFESDPHGQVGEAVTDGGLPGALVTTTGEHHGVRTLRLIAAFADARYLYALELVSRRPPLWAEQQEVFSRVWRSVVAVPAAAADAVGGTFAPWVD